MFARFRLFLGSSIGKKAAMSLTGLALAVFLIGHLAGNLLFFKDADHRTFDAYGEAMRNNPLLPLFEIGLTLLFVVHLALALITTKQNREARRSRYALAASRGERTVASSSMLISGGIVLVFVIVHLFDFRLREPAADGLAAMVVRRLSEPAGALIYLAGVLALGVHLSHALRSALQSLGINHPRYNPLIQKGAPILAGVLFVGFAAFPVLLYGAANSSSTADAVDPGAAAAREEQR